MKNRILVALSGGVDSSVAAALLVEQGFRVEGAYMKNWINEPGIAGDCPWMQDIEDARAACEVLGIPFRVVNLMTEYREKVVRYMLDGYRSGITPNPDVMCNREIKFGVFLDWALEHGFDRVATGHYSKLKTLLDGEVELHEAADGNKDQSYFLALLRQHQLRRAVFPLGDLQKPEVRRIAARFGLPNADKKDSQGICFIGNVRMADFLRAHVPDAPGPAYDTNGQRVGEHRGLHLYTLGQKRGTGISCPLPNRSYVVVEKRWEDNALIVAPDGADAPGLFARECWVRELSFPSSEPMFRPTLSVRPRYRAPLQQADLREEPSATWNLCFHRTQRALTPGQIAAFYDGTRLVAGGIVARVLPETPLPERSSSHTQPLTA